MSTSDGLPKILDTFAVPAMSGGLADRIVAAAVADTGLPPLAEPRRERRGLWRRGRQVVIGSLAVGLFSAAAVASGLLGRAGIEVPILSAMLAPKPKPAAKPIAVAQRVAKPVPKATPVVKHVEATAVLTHEPLTLDPVTLPRAEIRAERRAIRQQFAAEHPVAAARIVQRVRETLRERAIERRRALAPVGIDPSLPGAGTITPEARMALAEAGRRDRQRAVRMIDRRIEARRVRQAQRAVEVPGGATVGTLASAPSVEPGTGVAPNERRPDRLKRNRAARIDRIRERREQRFQHPKNDAPVSEGETSPER